MTGLVAVARMEWIKLRSLWSTGWIFAIFAASMVGLAILSLGFQNQQLSPAELAAFDPTQAGFQGLLISVPAIGILGVLAITGEFSSGLIRTTLAAVPSRPRVLAAKAAVLAAVTLVAGEVLAFAAFFAGEGFLASSKPHASLGQEGVARAVLMGGAIPCLFAFIGLGLGALVRHTAAAVSLVFGVLFVLPVLAFTLQRHGAIIHYTPFEIAQNSMVAVKPVSGAIGPWQGLLVMCLYAAAALAAGGWSLTRRDA
jgi:ABC-type transport system involved in multi-copper enzyme maturation permease subunit